MDKVRQISSTLQLLLNGLPQSREKAMVLRWSREIATFGKRRENRLKVLAAIGDGANTLAEISAETQIPRMTCYKILVRLTDENLINSATVRNTNNRSELRFEMKTVKSER